jgi:hypothetical protein
MEINVVLVEDVTHHSQVGSQYDFACPRDAVRPLVSNRKPGKPAHQREGAEDLKPDPGYVHTSVRCDFCFPIRLKEMHGY